MVSATAGSLVPESVPVPARQRLFDWAKRAWRPAGTVVAVALAALLMWHVINGKNGLSVWQQKRAEDRDLQKQIQDVQQENAHLRQEIERLKTDPAKNSTTPSPAKSSTRCPLHPPPSRSHQPPANSRAKSEHPAAKMNE